MSKKTNVYGALLAGSLLLFLGSCLSSWDTYSKKGHVDDFPTLFLAGAGVIGFVLFSWFLDKSETRDLNNLYKSDSEDVPVVSGTPWDLIRRQKESMAEGLEPLDDLEEFEEPSDDWWEKPQG